MSTRFKVIAALLGVLMLVCCGGTAVLGGYSSASSSSAASGTGCGTSSIDPDGTLPEVGDLSQESIRMAAIIIAVGRERGVAPRGWIIAVATALQESNLSNLGDLGDNNDHDSLGLFQQRPSQGWGTPEQIKDPRYAAGKFYEHLVKVENWASLPLTQAAQAVQRSAYPDAYAKHERLATEIVNALSPGAGSAVSDETEIRCAAPGEISASGWTIPLRGTVGSGFRTQARPNHQGVDIIVPKDTPIFAASSGRVVQVKCDIEPASWGCDRDGNPTTPGCGFYVDILHAQGVVTRYCHQIRQPLVHIGDEVDAGQQIGSSGSSGHSSGPHLHFEVHLNGDRSSNGAIDPIRFMESVGAPL